MAEKEAVERAAKEGGALRPEEPLPAPRKPIPRYSDRFRELLTHSAPPEPPAEALKPVFFYRVRTLGVGANSFVHLVQDDTSKAVFAQKVLTKAQTSARESLEETKIQLFLSRHPNIVRLYHAYDDETHLFLIMEYVASALKDLPLPQSEESSVAILRQLTEALRFVHSQGVVHADVKLENALLASVEIDYSRGCRENFRLRMRVSSGQAEGRTAGHS